MVRGAASLLPPLFVLVLCNEDKDILVHGTTCDAVCIALVVEGMINAPARHESNARKICKDGRMISATGGRQRRYLEDRERVRGRGRAGGVGERVGGFEAAESDWTACIPELQPKLQTSTYTAVHLLGLLLFTWI